MNETKDLEETKVELVKKYGARIKSWTDKEGIHIIIDADSAEEANKLARFLGEVFSPY